MKGDARRRFRAIAPFGAMLVFLALYLIAQGVLFALEKVWNIQLMGGRGRVGAYMLIVFAAIHGLARVFSSHPCFDPQYCGWLSTVPWRKGKPLPFAPVEMVWDDAVVLGVLMLAAAILPTTIAPWLLVAWLMANLGALCLSFLSTDRTVFCYPTLLGTALAVLVIDRPYVAIAILAATYVIAYEGVKRALDSFYWTPKWDVDLAGKAEAVIDPGGQVGWPYQRLLGDAVSVNGVNVPDAILCVLTAALWIQAGSTRIADPNLRFIPVLAAFIGAFVGGPWIRLAIYRRGYAAPLTLAGRLAVPPFIIPRHDVVFVTPICCWIAGPALLVGLESFAPLEIRLLVAAAAMALIALLGPPGLRRWRLTGGHAMTVGGERSSGEFLEAG